MSGDEYKKGDVVLMKGDCMELLKEIPDESVDLVLVDPPYGIIKGLKLSEDYEERVSWDVMLPMEELFKKYERIIRNNGRLIVFSQGRFTKEVRDLESKKLRYSTSLYWEKENFANYLSVNRAPVSYIEDLTVFNKVYSENKRLKKYAESVLEYTKKKGSQLNKERGDQKLHHFFTRGFQFSLPQPEPYQWLIDKYEIDEMSNFKTYEEMREILRDSTYNLDEGNYNSNLLKYRKGSGNYYHPTEKPVDLLSHLIRVYTNEGDLVLDNTMGSGSTGVAAIKENRRFIGMELDDEYYNVAKGRIEREVDLSKKKRGGEVNG